jgi:hypothetical protein
MEFVANILEKPQIRRETLGGKEFIVTHGTIIVPGVLPGSQGALYYPPEECGRNAYAWDHMPITLYHPMLNGVGVSAHNPDVLEKQGLGFIRDTTMNGKLGTEMWFDVDRTRRLDGRVLRMLENAQKIELSTGLFTDNDPAGLNAHYNGRGYDAVARNYRPDHIAILPDQVGACSIADGCGVNNQQAENAFCATGEGGGQDNSCSPGQSGGFTPTKPKPVKEFLRKLFGEEHREKLEKERQEQVEREKASRVGKPHKQKTDDYAHGEGGYYETNQGDDKC